MTLLLSLEDSLKYGDAGGLKCHWLIFMLVTNKIFSFEWHDDKNFYFSFFYKRFIVSVHVGLSALSCYKTVEIPMNASVESLVKTQFHNVKKHDKG